MQVSASLQEANKDTHRLVARAQDTAWVPPACTFLVAKGCPLQAGAPIAKRPVLESPGVTLFMQLKRDPRALPL